MTLALWIDPSDPTTVTTEDGQIKQVTDKSAAGNDLVSTGPGDLIMNFDPGGSPDAKSSPPAYTSDDYGRRILTFSGTAELDTGFAKFGQASLRTGGVGLVEVPNSPDLHLTDQDFTMEMWIRYNTAPAVESWLECWNGSQRMFLWGMNSTTSMQFAGSYNGSGTSLLIQRTWTPSPVQTGRWIHVAVAREGGTIRMYADGAQVGADDTAVSTNAFHRSTGGIGVGARIGGSDHFDGNIDGLRILIGKALYTGTTYTIPTEAPAVAPTEYLQAWSNKSPGLAGLDTSAGFLRGKNASPRLTNMDGPDFTATIAISDFSASYDYTQDQVIFGMTGDTSPVGGDGWRIKFIATSPQTYRIVASIGDETASPEQAVVIESDLSPQSSFLRTGFAVITFQYDSVRQYVQAFMNGEYIGSASFTGTIAFGNDVKLGGGDTAGFSNGKILEAVYYDGFLPGDELRRLEGYMANKWGFADALPTDHLYRYRGPERSPAETVLVANFISNADAVASPPGYTAETGQVANFIGNGNLDTDEFVYGGSSYQGDGSSDSVVFPDSADWDFGTGDFTLECWAKWDALGVTTLMSTYVGASQGMSLQIRSDSTTFRFSWGDFVKAQTTLSPYIVTGRWYHVAASREDGTIRLFLDGVVMNETFESPVTDITGSTSGMRIGALTASLQSLDGNIDSVRVVKGKAIYTKAFTPPNRGFIAPPPKADFIANFNGVDAAASPPAYTSEDQYAQVATFVGNAQLDTAQKRFGISSALFDGSGDRITFPQLSPSILDLGNEDFTLECSVRFNGDPGTGNMVFMGKWGTTPLRSWVIGVFNNQLGFYYSTNGSDAPVLQTAWNPVGDQWYDIVFERYDNVLYFYVDGVCLSVQALSATVYSAVTEFGVGANINSGVVSNPFNGWIDNCRVTVGTAIYKDVLKRPQDYPYNKEEEDPNSILLPFNTFTSASPDAAASPPIYASEDNFGLSLRFDGSAQIDTAIKRMGIAALAAPSTSDDAEIVQVSPELFGAGTNDWTIEFWIRPSALGGGNKIIYDHRQSGNGAYHTLYITSGNNLYYFVNGANSILGSLGLSTNTWYHVVVERTASTVRMFINGLMDGAINTDTTTYLDGGNISLMDAGDESSGGCAGHMDGVRLNFTKAIYTGTVPVPGHPHGEPIVLTKKS